ncbi:MAG: hypothetical protein EPN23_00625 [Verrucomicrobia bacterium]|nr:MAG: hypothetical protein EPN23_00625 [Verrucomicrobiota bacterium]
MKTLIGHLVGGGVPSVGSPQPRFFQGLEKRLQHSFHPWNAAVPFVPLRQPLGGHGNPRKEHPTLRAG